MTIPIVERYPYKVPVFTVLRNSVRQRIFRFLTKNSLPLLLRGGDIISVDPQLNGYHEFHIKRLIELFAEYGYGDFLIDIGANIGLTSCQSGDRFKQVYMFEPNPDVFSILRINAKVALRKCTYHLYNVGLGETTGTTTLTVPVHNWGGAFIRGSNNAYTDGILANKDGFSSLASGSYDYIEIKIESAVEVLERLFSEITKSNLRGGVIKVDVEGYEPVVLNAIADTLPASVKVMIVYENWDDKYVTRRVVERFLGRATSLKIAKTPDLKVNLPFVSKFIRLIANRGIAFKLSSTRAERHSGDIVLLIKSVS